jgi:hypothetical protein
MPNVRSEKLISLQEWREFVDNVALDTTIHDHGTAFQPHVKFPDKLRTILENFGAQTLAGWFAVRRPRHNYIATVFRKSAGDEDDCVMINSLARGADP